MGNNTGLNPKISTSRQDAKGAKEDLILRRTGSPTLGLIDLGAMPKRASGLAIATDVGVVT